MIYDDIKNHYYSIVSAPNAPSKILSNFHDASKDDCGTSVVANYLPCLKFDVISQFLYQYLYHASDALFFSDKLKRLLFVEFKNRHYDKNDNNSNSTINKIVKQAGDTLFLHCDICRSITNYDKIESDFIAVIDSLKNNDLPRMSVQEIMLFLSGRTIGGTAADQTNAYLESLVVNYLSNKYPNLSYNFHFIGIVLSVQFNNVISRYT